MTEQMYLRNSFCMCCTTRNNTINLPIVHTEVEKRFTIYQCCHLITEINPNFLEPQSLVTLKKNFKLHLLSMY